MTKSTPSEDADHIADLGEVARTFMFAPAGKGVHGTLRGGA
jgi:hypothetical protein